MRPLVQLSVTLLQNKSATGSLITVQTPGVYTWNVNGVFGGCTATLEFLSLDGVTWNQVLSATAPFTAPIFVEAGCSMRVRIDGGSGINISSHLELLA